jgi:L-ascorbate metabolism protein UlaG (beta-lactamase superfamily)
MKFTLLLFVGLFITSGLVAQSRKPVIYYVGNMGVAIVQNDSVILIDALHDYYDAPYLPSDKAILYKLQSNEKPFLHLVAIAATHMHDDHFDDTLISQVSNSKITSKIILGKQPASKLTGTNKQKLHVIDQQGTVRLSNGLSITLKNVGHSGSRNHSVENYRIEVAWGSYRFVHFGDAPDARAFEGLLPGADVAIVPYWFCFDEKDLQTIEGSKVKAIIATHIDPRGVAPFGKSSMEIAPFKTYGQRYVLK